MITRIKKHGNSYCIMIPKGILQVLEITDETDLKVTTDGKGLTITPVRSTLKIPESTSRRSANIVLDSVCKTCKGKGTYETVESDCSYNSWTEIHTCPCQEG